MLQTKDAADVSDHIKAMKVLNDHRSNCEALSILKTCSNLSAEDVSQNRALIEENNRFLKLDKFGARSRNPIK